MKKTKFVLVATVIAILCAMSLPNRVFADDFDTSARPGIYISQFLFSGSDSFFQIYNDSDTNVAVESLAVQFYNSSHSLRSDVLDFGSGVFASDGSILVKASTSPMSDFDQVYTSSWAAASGGAIELIVNGVRESTVCWGSQANCNAFSAVRLGTANTLPANSYWQNYCLVSPECINKSSFTRVVTGVPADIDFGGFIPNIITPDPDPDPDPDPEKPTQHCAALRLSEISTNEQWIELYNNSDAIIRAENLKNCFLSVQYGDKTPPNFDRYKLALDQYISDGSIDPYGYLLIDVALANNLSLPKSVKDRGILISDGSIEYDSTIYSTQKSGTAMAYFSDDWKTTFAPTPGVENVYQKWQTCEIGKHINEATGNCIKDPDPPAECAEGQFRNPLTGRCKKIAVANELTDCADGYFRNPLTNRCKKIAVEPELKPCAEGWERNPETNRCRKKVSSESAAFAVQPGDPTGGNMMALLASAGVVILTTGIVLFQFRMELAGLARRLFPKRVRINV